MVLKKMFFIYSKNSLNFINIAVVTFKFKQYMSFVRKPAFLFAKTKTQISFAVIAKLFSDFVVATQIVQSLYFLDPKFHASRHFL